MDELLEILQDIDDSVDYEKETKLIDDHILDSFAPRELQFCSSNVENDSEAPGELIKWPYIPICTCWYSYRLF